MAKQATVRTWMSGTAPVGLCAGKVCARAFRGPLAPMPGLMHSAEVDTCAVCGAVDQEQIETRREWNRRYYGV